MTLNEILISVRAWLEYIKIEYASKIKIEVIQDNDTILRVIFETEFFISELIVNEPSFAPYRYVSFQVMSAKEAINDALVYCYYDNSACTITEIINQLNTGLEVAISC